VRITQLRVILVVLLCVCMLRVCVLRGAQEEEEPFGSIGITCEPKDVSIWLDGYLMGFSAPVLLEKVKPGIHKLIISRPGHETWRDTVRITADELSSIEAVLDSVEYDEHRFVKHNLPDFFDLDHEEITLDMSAYRSSGVASWELSILNMSGNTFRTLAGKRSPPSAIGWDGRAEDSTQILTVDDAYTFIFKLVLKKGAVKSRVGEEIEIKGIAYDNVVAVKENEMEYIGMIQPPVVTRYFDYVISRFDAMGYSRLTVVTPTVERARPIIKYLAVNLPYARLNSIIDSTCARVEFILD